MRMANLAAYVSEGQQTRSSRDVRNRVVRGRSDLGKKTPSCRSAMGVLAGRPERQ